MGKTIFQFCQVYGIWFLGSFNNCSNNFNIVSPLKTYKKNRLIQWYIFNFKTNSFYSFFKFCTKIKKKKKL